MHIQLISKLNFGYVFYSRWYTRNIAYLKDNRSWRWVLNMVGKLAQEKHVASEKDITLVLFLFKNDVNWFRATLITITTIIWGIVMVIQKCYWSCDYSYFNASTLTNYPCTWFYPISFGIILWAVFTSLLIVHALSYSVSQTCDVASVVGLSENDFQWKRSNRDPNGGATGTALKTEVINGIK